MVNRTSRNKGGGTIAGIDSKCGYRLLANFRLVAARLVNQLKGDFLFKLLSVCQ